MSRRVAVPTVAPATVGSGAHDVLTGRGAAVAPIISGPLDEAGARRLTDHIRAAARDIADQLIRLQSLVEAARDGDAWEVLGFPSWPAYVLDVLEPIRLPKPQRREVVGWLTGMGLSSRAIAGIVDVDQKTVVNDRKLLHASATPAGEETSSPASVTGLDGRTYATTVRTLSVVPALPATPLQDEGPLAAPTRPDAAAALLAVLRHHLLTTGTVTTEDWNQGVVAAERSLRRTAD